MARRLRLTRWELENVNYHWLNCFRLRVEASDPEGMDAFVFLYRRGLPDPRTGEPVDRFIGICGPVDLEDYPPLEPNPDAPSPFYRLDYVELDLRNVDLANQTWEIIVLEVAYLKQALDRLELLRPTLELWIGGPPPESTSGSSSSSASASASASLSS